MSCKLQGMEVDFAHKIGCHGNVPKSFYGRDNELQTYHGNFTLMDNKHGKLFVVKQSKECKFMPKLHQSRLRLAAGLCTDPLGEPVRSPFTAMGAYF